MKGAIKTVYVGLVTAVAYVALTAPAHAAKCKKDAVQVGDVCVDKYEASVWETTDAGAIKKIQKGKITDASQLAGVATQRGAESDDYGAGCPNDAAGCMDFYAVSIPGVTPSRFITWFQAAAACRNAGKRFATNQEWQAAALGTPDTGGADNGTTDCNTDSTSVASTGSRSGCISDVGAFDMVGNLNEWVADWVPRSTMCGSWSGLGSDDAQCLAGPATTGEPGALVRGGLFGFGSSAGPFSVGGFSQPSRSFFGIGFRCARARSPSRSGLWRF